MKASMKSVVVVLLIVALVLAAAWYFTRSNPGRIIGITSGGNAGAVPYSAPPEQEQLQECDPLVTDAWKRLAALENDFIERFAALPQDKQNVLQAEQEAMFFVYEPYDGDRIPEDDPKDTPAQRAQKEIWRIGRSFELAMKLNPGNPSNYVSYGIFLKPRNEALAVENIKTGISLWPSNYAFHFILADFLYRTVSSNRFQVMKGMHPQLRRVQNEKEIFSELAEVEKYDPRNPFVNLYHAQVMITFAKDAVDIMHELKKAVDNLGTPSFILPPPRPAEMQYWYDTKSLQAKITDIHYDIEGNYGYYLDQVFSRYITDGGLREAAEREGPQVFVTMFTALSQMAFTQPLDKSEFYLVEQTAQTMKEFYAGRGNADAAKACDGLLTSEASIESEIRKLCATDKDQKPRFPPGVNALDPNAISMENLEAFVRRNNPGMRDEIYKYHPRFITESDAIVQKYPESPDPSKKGAFWKENALPPQALPTTPDQAGDSMGSSGADNGAPGGAGQSAPPSGQAPPPAAGGGK